MLQELLPHLRELANDFSFVFVDKHILEMPLFVEEDIEVGAQEAAFCYSVLVGEQLILDRLEFRMKELCESSLF